MACARRTRRWRGKVRRASEWIGRRSDATRSGATTYNRSECRGRVRTLSNPPNEILNIERRGARAMRAAIAFALPQRCALCARATGDACLCDGCASAIAPAGPACPRCALPTPAGAVCGRCVAHPPAFDAALAAGLYAFPLDRLVMRLKYAADLPLAAALGAHLARVAASAGAIARVDALVPMPLAAARQRARGCNQARE